jgi:hypothetical protein
MSDDYFDDELEVVRNRKAAMELAYRQARAGDPICKDLFVLQSQLTKGGLAFIPTMLDYADEDEDDDIRPY